MPVVFRTMNGTHQIIVVGDDRPATPEILEQRLASWERKIATWKPHTRWDVANQRSLRWLKKRRSKASKAVCRVTNSRKEIVIQERREQRLKEREFENASIIAGESQ